MDGLVASMTPEQMDEWIAADRLDQVVGLEKLYVQLALIATALVNTWGGKAEPEMFLPDYDGKQQATTKDGVEIASPNQAAMLFRAWGANNGKEVK